MTAGKGGTKAAALFLAALTVAASEPLHAGGQGTTKGTAAFQAKGEVKEYKPGILIWAGNFVGVSLVEAGTGPLHNAGWECSGETVLQDAKAYRAGGFCVVTDPEGDTINLVWERQDVPGAASEGNNKGTYLSGTGKYAGIQGHYTIRCRLSGAMAICGLTGGEYRIP
jgi:hypothetical protein